MASPNKRRQKKRRAKAKQEGRTRPSRPIVENARNLLRIGGTVEAMTKPQEREGRLARALGLRCEDSPKRITRPWVNVHDSFGDFIEEQAVKGRPICLAGYIRSLKEPHPVTHQMWELYATQVLCRDRTNPNPGHLACNEIRARGFVTSCRPRVVGRFRNHACQFGLRCEGPGSQSNLIEMVAFYNPEADITGIIERWPRRRELSVAARVNTYGDGYSVTNIVATAVLVDLDEQVPR
jgi:hypothetical protein